MAAAAPTATIGLHVLDGQLPRAAQLCRGAVEVRMWRADGINKATCFLNFRKSLKHEAENFRTTDY